MRNKKVVTCFSGHRPGKLEENGAFYSVEIRKIKAMLQDEILRHIDMGCKRFLTGLADGIDLIAAEIVINLKKDNDLELIGVRPFAAHGDNFKAEWRALYDYVLPNCDGVVLISEKYFDGVYKKRNCYMIDNSTHLIAVVKDYNSGTGQTIAYANKLHRQVKILI